MQENVTDAQLGSYKSGMDAALDLKNGKLDAVMLDELPAKSIVAQNDDLTIIDFNLEPEEYAIAVKKGNTELLDAINATIARMQGDGSYEALVNAFMPAEGEEAIKVPEALETTGDVIKMGTNAAFKPFEYAEGSEIVGFDISMAQNVAKDMGRKLQVEDMAFDSLLSALDTGTIDFVAAGMTATEERRQSVDFSEPYFDSGVVMGIKADNGEIKGYADLAGKNVAIKKGTEGAAFAESIMDEYGFTVTYFADSSNMYEDVKAGNSAACFEDYPVLGYAISQDIGLKIVTEMERGNSYGFAVNKGQNPELIEMFDAGLQNLRDSGKYQEILDTYIKK